MTYSVQMSADVIIQLKNNDIVLIQRNKEPYKNLWALPGGRLEPSETLEQTAIREASEETGLEIKLKKIIGVYSNINRDPRGRMATVVYLAKSVGGELKAASDAKNIKTISPSSAKNLAFDHEKIIQDFLNTA